MQKTMYILFCHIIRNMYTVVCGVFLAISIMAQGMGGRTPDFSNLTPEEIQALDQAAQEIEQYVSTLPPEQQAEFHQAVADFEQMISSMSEEELNQFLEAMMTQELAHAQEITQQPTPVPSATIPIKEPIEVKEEKPKFTDAQQKILNTLTAIIDLSDAFLVKMQNVPDIDSKFNQWLQQGKLTNIAPHASWEEFKSSIDAFRQNISDMRKIDAKTKKYLFLEALSKAETLYQALLDLELQLKNYEPAVVVASFGIERLNTNTKAAIQKILNVYAITMQKTADEIKKLFDTYEPEAQKIREEEKKLIEQAGIGRQQPYRTAPSSGGIGGNPYKGTPPSSKSRGNYNDYYGYPQSEGYGPYQSGDYNSHSSSQKSRPATDGSTSPSSKPSKNKDDKSKEEKVDKKHEIGKKEKKKTEKEITKKKSLSSASCPTDPDTPEGILSLIRNNLDATDELIADSSNLLTDIIATVTSPEGPDDQFAIVTIPRLVRRAKTLQDLITKYMHAAEAARPPLRKITEQIPLEEKTSNTYQQTVEELGKELRKHPLITKVLPQLDTLVAELSKDDVLLKRIPANKRYAYLGPQELRPKIDTTVLQKPSEGIQKKYPKTSLDSLVNLHKQLDGIRTKIPHILPKKILLKDNLKDDILGIVPLSDQ